MYVYISLLRCKFLSGTSHRFKIDFQPSRKFVKMLPSKSAVLLSTLHTPQNKLKHPVEGLLNFARNVISFVVHFFFLRTTITIN